MDLDGIALDAFGTLFDLGDLRERFASSVVPWTWHAAAAGRFRPLPALVEMAGIDPERVRTLTAYDDVPAGLDRLRERAPLAVLSNGTRDGVRALVGNAGLADRFDHLLTADQAGRYKPAPELYALAPRAFGTEAGRVLLVSGNEWDVAGAAQSGMRTAWLSRGREPRWLFGIEADVVAPDLAGLTLP